MAPYDVIVIGGGHAGVEAAWAAASALGDGGRVALITMDPTRIGAMSCNPAIGGLAKGQMVREVDALGGVMGRATDHAGIMFKVLNRSKGAAVRGPRAQCDKYHYAAEVQRILSTQPAIEVIAGTVDDLLVEDGRCVGVRLPDGWRDVHADAGAVESNLACDRLARPVFAHPGAPRSAAVLRAAAVVLTTGTFMRALMHTGDARTEGGRVGEGSAVGISAMLRS
ncbi:MAG: FAD-dependent oxidoreductase, partial [Phycisphaerales bacterium]